MRQVSSVVIFGWPAEAVDLDVLIAEEPVGGLVAPVVAAAFAAGRALLPAARRQVPLRPFFADCHAAIVARVSGRDLWATDRVA